MGSRQNGRLERAEDGAPRVPAERELLGRNWIPLAVLALGLGSIVMLLGSNWIRSRLMAEDMELVLAVGTIQTDVAVSHLWTEELVAGDSVDVAEIDRRLEDSTRLAEGLSGDRGLNRRRLLFEPDEDGVIGRRVADLRLALARFRDLSIERRRGFAEGGDVGIGSAMDTRYDLAFGRLLDDLVALGAAFQGRLDRAEDRSALLNRILLVAWVLIVGLAVTGLWTRERRRQETESALRRSEELFLQAQKMEAVGRLAGGIAHDINNYLAAIITQCELVRMKAEPDSRVAEKMDAVIATATRSSQLVKRLLAFSRRQPVRPEIVDVNEALRGLEKMVRRLVGEDIALHARLGLSLGFVKIDPSQLEQIVLNLVVNAREAMPTGGRLEIVTARAEPADLEGQAMAGASPGAWLKLSVSDTGVGVPAEIREKVFEPFFSTKEGEGNSGLGLATVHGIVSQVGGRVTLESEPGAGTVVEVLLPTHTGPAPASRAPSVAQAAVQGSGRILLVEDNDVVRRSLTRLLEALGYEVTAAADGPEALAQVTEKGLAPDLVVTDVVMPAMSGKVLAERLWDVDPGLQILFVSGHTDDVVLRHGIEEGSVDFLQKPFSAEDLGRTIREMLSR